MGERERKRENPINEYNKQSKAFKKKVIVYLFAFVNCNTLLNNYYYNNKILSLNLIICFFLSIILLIFLMTIANNLL